MTDSTGVRREPRLVILGILLIAFGTVLLLDRLDVFFVRWNGVAWLVGSCFGLFFAIDGMMRRLKGRLFWGTALFFVSVYWLLARWDVIHHHGFFVLPMLLFSLGISFLMLFAIDRRQYAVLLPAFLFCGIASVMMLWWWEVVEWYEVRSALRTYWPLIFVVWGTLLLFQRKKSPAQIG